MAILRFYWLRHAPPVNPGNICYGADMSVDLSDVEAIKRQADRLPKSALWLASPLPRTMETAAALSHQRMLPVVGAAAIETRDRLKEQSFGDWVGKPREDLRSDPGFAPYMGDPVNVAPPGGESLAVFSRRVNEDIDEIVATKSQGGNCIIVAHAGTIRAALAKATGVSMAEALRLPVSPLSLTVIEYDSDKKAHGQNPWTLESLNLKP